MWWTGGLVGFLESFSSPPFGSANAWTSEVLFCHNSLQAASALLILRANGSKIVLPWFCFLIARPSSSPLFSCTQEQEPSSSPLFSCTQSVSHPKTDVNISTKENVLYEIYLRKDAPSVVSR
ncbi:hypothetical protein JHK86_053064 [Glycine max]|uniref:Uncharacterized protein n=1 Tax=Glycine max TaxID=3847 RepID=K7MXN8_SOYBN|nr:hypothetical protein JHK86_053064 [Glycine max]